MKRITHITPIISKEITLGVQYMLMSEVRGEIIILNETEIRLLKKLGMPNKWGMYSCVIEEVSPDAVNLARVVPFCETAMDRCYELCHHPEGHATLCIDWSA